MLLQQNVLLRLCAVGVFCLLTNGQDAPRESTQCATAKAAKAESYIETASLLLDKLKDNLPEGGGDCSCPPQPLDCAEVAQCGRNRSGVYEVWPRNRILFGSVSVYCDLEGHGGGWTVIQRRGDYKRPAEFFDKSWHDYKSGFGDLRRDFWLGNDNIYALTNQRRYYLRIDMTERGSNESQYAFYDQFWIDNEAQHYKLHAYDYSGDAGDALRSQDGHVFSTSDRGVNVTSCSRRLRSGWWFDNQTCGDANLNGVYDADGDLLGITWLTWGRSLGTVEMKVRPADFKVDLLEMDIDAV